MRRIIVGVVAMALLAGAAWAVTPAKATKAKPVKAEGYHHLLMLDMKEAAEHARILRQYADTHPQLETAVVTKHVDEIGKNLEGARTELKDLEQNVPAGEKSAIDPQLAAIRAHQQSAEGEFDALKAEASKPAPEARIVAEKSKAIYTAMTAANESHHRAMVKRNVKEPVATKP